jgi:hypothetical protein
LHLLLLSDQSTPLQGVEFCLCFYLNFFCSRLDLEVDSELTRFLELHDSVLIEASDIPEVQDDEGKYSTVLINVINVWLFSSLSPPLYVLPSSYPLSPASHPPNFVRFIPIPILHPSISPNTIDRLCVFFYEYQMCYL